MDGCEQEARHYQAVLLYKYRFHVRDFFTQLSTLSFYVVVTLSFFHVAQQN